ncbi:class II fructose-bisphosphate aldolase [Oscillospiraceae bacterium OttesenSCG-928-G22]|nr:class II fructose-bisphosphate aldolase [Oscillospiraceae bacterium OttesenSCG-928-G22]
MSIASFKELLVTARTGGYGVGAFNILNQLTARAVVAAAERAGSPVILQTSVSTVKRFGVDEIIGFLRPLAKAASVPVAIHLDHCTDEALAKQCVDAGWTAVMIDGSALPFEENAAMTRRLVDYARPKGVDVEGEIGLIQGVEDNVKSDVTALASVDDSLRFIKLTDVDALAPSIGTAHGVYTGEPVIQFDLVETLAKETDVPIVVHGGTGLKAEVFARLIGLGASKVNVSTAIKQAYLGAMLDYAADEKRSKNPLTVDAAIEKKVSDCVYDHLSMFGAIFQEA